MTNDYKNISKCMTKEIAQHLVRHPINKSAEEKTMTEGKCNGRLGTKIIR